MTDPEKIHALGEEMMIKEMKKELSYGKSKDTEETDEVEKDNKVADKKNDFTCVFCGSKRGVIYHKGKYICGRCLHGLRKEYCLEYGC